MTTGQCNSVVRTTGFGVIDETNDPVMTGDEEYGIVGGDGIQSFSSRLMDVGLARKLLAKCKGLNLYYDCLEKAKLVAGHFDTQVTLGACMVVDKKCRGSYGFYYNPPYEFHAWVEIKAGHPPVQNSQEIVDLALPGLILKGNQMQDEMGPVINKEPVILAGTPRKWMIYCANRKIDRNQIQKGQALVF